jgi:hypothetical protein
LSSGVLTSLDRPALDGPDAIATYCLPLTSKVIGGAVNPEPTLIFQSCSSVLLLPATPSRDQDQVKRKFGG